jgi:glycosyltransferase involved in cell wall biosynthesis
MKILIYQPRCSYYVGGGEIVPLEQAKFLAKLGNEVILLTTKIYGVKNSDVFNKFVVENPEITFSYIEVDPPLSDIYSTNAGMSKYRWDLESYHIGLKAREIISHIADNNTLCIAHYIIDLIAIPKHLKYVLHLHGYPSELSYLDQIAVYKNYNLIAVSNLIAKKWIDLLNFDNYKIETCYNGIDTNTMFPIEIPKKFDAGYIGRLIEIKGVQNIIEAIRILRDSYDVYISFAIAGTGPFEQSLKNLVQEYNLTDRITFLGYLPTEDLIIFYNSLSFSILPSYDREGVLTTMLESSACGIPVISSKNTSMAEFITNGFNGLLVDPKNPEEIAEAIKSLNEDTSLRAELSKNTLDCIKKNWTWEIRSRELEVFYRNFLKQ